MNRVITTGLFVFALAALNTPIANADTRVGQQQRLTPSHANPIQAVTERSEPEKVKASELQTKPLATAQPTANQTISERDRLILERQQLRLIPRQ